MSDTENRTDINHLSNNDLIKVNDWLRENRDKIKNKRLDSIARSCSTALGIKVTTHNVRARMEDEEIPYKKRTSSANTQVAKLRKEFEGFRESTAKTLANLRQEIDELKKPAPTAASSEQPYSQPVAVEHTSDPQPPLFHHPQQQTQTLPTQ